MTDDDWCQEQKWWQHHKTILFFQRKYLSNHYHPALIIIQTISICFENVFKQNKMLKVNLQMNRNSCYCAPWQHETKWWNEDDSNAKQFFIFFNSIATLFSKSNINMHLNLHNPEILGAIQIKHRSVLYF